MKKRRFKVFVSLFAIFVIILVITSILPAGNMYDTIFNHAQEQDGIVVHTEEEDGIVYAYYIYGYSSKEYKSIDIDANMYNLLIEFFKKAELKRAVIRPQYFTRANGGAVGNAYIKILDHKRFIEIRFINDKYVEIDGVLYTYKNTGGIPELVSILNPEAMVYPPVPKENTGYYK